MFILGQSGLANDKSMTPQTTYYYKKYNLTMADPHPYKLPVLRKSDSLNKPWYVEYYVFSEKDAVLKRKRVVLKQPTAIARTTAAKEIISQISDLLKKGAVINKTVKPTNLGGSTLGLSISTIQDTITHYLEFHKKIVKPNTYESYKLDLKRFQKFLIRNNLQTLTIKTFGSELAYQCMDELTSIEKLGNRTRNNVKATLVTFFNFYRKRKIVDHNPFDDIAKLRAPVHKHTAIADYHVKPILDKCIETNELQLQLFIYFEYYAAIRPNTELRLLKISDILDKTICINADDAKSAEKMHIAIPPPLEKKITEFKLRDYPKDFYVFSKNGKPGIAPNGKKYQYMRHRKILKALNIDHLNYDLYSWKHTGVIALFKTIQDIEVIRQHCRHSNIDTTQKYLRDLGQFIDTSKIDLFPEI
jgi:site-specific recombinase XerD